MFFLRRNTNCALSCVSCNILIFLLLSEIHLEKNHHRHHQVQAFSAHLERPWTMTPPSKRKRKRAVRRTLRKIRFSVTELLSSVETPEPQSSSTKTTTSENSSNSSNSSNNQDKHDDGGREDEEYNEDDEYDDINSEPINGEPFPPNSIPSSLSDMPVVESKAVEPLLSVVPSDHGTVAAAAAASSTTASTVSTTTVARSTVKSCLPDLIQMTRPSNIPGIVLFHMLGSYLSWNAVSNIPMLQGQTNVVSSYWGLLAKPSMMVVLVALILTSSTSMLVNDYYDYKLGVDSKTTKPSKPLPSQKVPLLVAKRFVSYLYAAALVCVTIIPGIPARLSVTTGLMLTFWYTQHVKPKTWLKNLVCASLIALSPLTSGVATLALLMPPPNSFLDSSSLSFSLFHQGVGPLMRLVLMLFAGIFGREMIMDINDVADDKYHGVRTVPVAYGTKFASAFAFACTGAMAGWALCAPVAQLASRWIGASMESTTPLSVIVRRLGLASIGSLFQLRRAYDVFQTEGQDPALVDRAVEEGLLSVVVLLASFV